MSGKSAGLTSITEVSTKPSLEMPPHAIAGLTGELAVTFERKAKVPIVRPVDGQSGRQQRNHLGGK